MRDTIDKFVVFEKIKSTYILKLIFSFLWNNRKLDIISNNKQIRLKLQIDIKNYKNACNREIIGEKNGKGKEYIINTSILVYNGEYKNRKRNGKGKEFYEDGKLKFEGEYLNGKRISGKKYDIKGNMILSLVNRKGMEYYDNGRIKFEGEYFNGIRWNGIGYNFEGKKDFEIKNGKGIGKEYTY